TPVNDAPKLSTQAMSTREDTPAQGQAQASDVDGDKLAFSIQSQGDKGEATIHASSGAITYTPHADVSGEDSFTVAVRDGSEPVTSKVVVTIVAVDDAPRVHQTTWQLQEDKPGETTLPATDVDGDKLTFTLVGQPKLGAARLLDAHKGTVSFTPQKDKNGADE